MYGMPQTYSEEDPPKRCLRIEYFDKEALHDFLFVVTPHELHSIASLVVICASS